MTCRLMRNDHVVTEGDVVSLEDVRAIADHDDHGVWVKRCPECGQLFLEVFVEMTTTQWKGDLWSFYVPVTEDECADADSDYRSSVGMVHSRPHLVWHPDGSVYRKAGWEVALAMMRRERSREEEWWRK